MDKKTIERLRARSAEAGYGFRLTYPVLDPEAGLCIAQAELIGDGVPCGCVQVVKFRGQGGTTTYHEAAMQEAVHLLLDLAFGEDEEEVETSQARRAFLEKAMDCGLTEGDLRDAAAFRAHVNALAPELKRKKSADFGAADWKLLRERLCEKFDTEVGSDASE